MSKLKLCPFCGGQAVLDEVDDYHNWQIKCMGKCRCMSIWYKDKNLAIARWNSRANGWIPVSEKWPELHDDKSSDCYLITNGIFIWMGYLNFDKEWVFAECTNAKRVIDWIEITAWQPLPEPYRRGNE